MNAASRRFKLVFFQASCPAEVCLYSGILFSPPIPFFNTLLKNLEVFGVGHTEILREVELDWGSRHGRGFGA